VRVLVTGGTGLVGSHATARLIADGHAVRALVRDAGRLAQVLAPLGVSMDRVEPALGDVLEPAGVRAAASGCDAAIHAAGFYSHEPREAKRLVRTNVEGTRNVLESALAAGLDPVVHVSSMLALFPPPGPRMRPEDPPTEPRAVYSRTKADAERVARALQAKGAPVVTVYPCSVQGPHDPTVVKGVRTGPHLLAEALRTGRVLVTQGGLGYTDARDLARVLAATLRPAQGPRRRGPGATSSGGSSCRTRTITGSSAS
jgi:nucleoside-diphosphate-sugar epimerase